MFNWMFLIAILFFMNSFVLLTPASQIYLIWSCKIYSDILVFFPRNSLMTSRFRSSLCRIIEGIRTKNHITTLPSSFLQGIWFLGQRQDYIITSTEQPKFSLNAIKDTNKYNCLNFFLLFRIYSDLNKKMGKFQMLINIEPYVFAQCLDFEMRILREIFCGSSFIPLLCLIFKTKSSLGVIIFYERYIQSI